MRVLVTGICGFVGSQIALHLQEEFPDAVLFGADNLSRAGSETNRRVLEARGIKVHVSDVRLASSWAGLPDADWVVDAAANPSVLAGIDGKSSPRQLLETNLWGTIEALEYCRQRKAGFLLLSTSRVYSIEALAALPVREVNRCFNLDTGQLLPPGVTAEGINRDFTVAAPVSLYGCTKLASEQVAMEYAAAFQVPVWINRCGVLSGAGQFGTPDQGIFAFWINAHLRHRAMRYIGFNGQGWQSRDVLHAQDVGRLVALQIRAPHPTKPRLYTVGGGLERLMSLARLTSWCDARFSPWKVEADPRPRPYDIPWFVMDSSAVKADLQWEPTWSLEMILDQIAAHAERHPGWLEISGA
jgi:CDP-paratose 2-epimerase